MRLTYQWYFLALNRQFTIALARNTARSDRKECLSLATSSRQQSQKSSGSTNRKNIVHRGWEWSQDVEAGKNDQSQEQRVVVKDGECGSFVVSNFIFLPQDPFVLLFLAHLLIISKSFVHLHSHSLFSFHSNLVLQRELGVSVRERHQPGGSQRDDKEDGWRGNDVHQMNPPEQPNWNCRHDESISIKQRVGLGRNISAEILQQQFFLPGKLLSLGRHFTGWRTLEQLTIINSTRNQL